MYMLFTKQAPFMGNSVDEIFKKIDKGRYSMEGYPWIIISDSAKDLISKMLQKDQDKRITASEALEHEWMNCENISETMSSTPEDLEMAINLLLQGKRHIILARAVLSYIATVLIKTEDQQKVSNIFRMLDQNNDSYIDVTDFEKALESLQKTEQVKKDTANLLALRCDINNQQKLSYSDILCYIIPINEFDLRIAFNFFDSNRDGIIESEDLLTIFGKYYNKAKIESILSQFCPESPEKVN